MSTTDPRVDAYIAAAAPFARPLLAHLRGVVHAGCPDAVETIKWGMPFFMHRGRPLANFAAFQQHCGFGFWRARGAAETDQGDEAMGQFGRITALTDLPPKRELVRLVREAVARIDAQAAVPRTPQRRVAAVPPEVPPELAAALARNAAARRTFEAFPPSRQRDYTEWIAEAKRDETRAKRLAQALEWLAEGKPRHWKHQGG